MSSSEAISDDQSTDKMLQVLQQILETMQRSTAFPPAPGGLASQFWADYHRIANEHDNELVERHVSNMDGLLIFAGLFSAVSSAFIIAIQPNLNSGSTSALSTNDLLRLLVLHTLNDTVALSEILSTSTSTTSPNASPGSIWIQSLAYAGLFASLLAAFGAVLAKQWLAHFKLSRWGRGSFEDRCKRRQAKVDGLQNWYFDAVLDTLPTLLHISFLLFGSALGANVWQQDRTVAAVIFAATALGGGFYVCVFFASMLSVDCPYHTPVAAALRAVPPSLERAGATILESLPEPIYLQIMHFGVHVRNALKGVSALQKILPLRQTTTVSTLPLIAELDLVHLLAFDLAPRRLVTLSLPDVPFDASTTSAVRWILETSTDPNTITSAALMIPELQWPLDCDVYAACHQLRSMMPYRLCFESALPEDHLYRICAKAIVHLNCITDSPAVSYDIWNVAFSDRSQNLEDRPDFIPISAMQSLMDAASVLPFLLDQPYVKQAWKDVAIDVVSKLLPMHDLPERVLVDCLLCVSLLFGIRIVRHDLIKRDKSLAKGALAASVMLLFQEALPNMRWDTLDYAYSLKHVSHYAGRALRLLVPLSHLPSHGILPKADKSQGRQRLVWILRLCSRLLQDVPISEGASDNDTEVRAVLHLGLSWVYEGECNGSQLCPWDSYGELNFTQRDLNSMVHYLNRIMDGLDYAAITAALLVLSNSGDIEDTHMQIIYFNSLIHCMKAGKPSHIRLWALKAAWNAVDDLVLIDGHTFQVKLLTVLHEVSSVDYRPLEWETTDPTLPYIVRDRCYLSLLSVLINDQSWRRNLGTTGHFRRCLRIGLDAWSHPRLSGWNKFRYAERVVDIFACAEIGAGHVQSTELMSATQVRGEDCWMLIVKAWDIVGSAFCEPQEHRLPYYEDLRPFIRYSMQCWSARDLTMNTDVLKANIQMTIGALKDDFPPDKRPDRVKRRVLPDEMLNGVQSLIKEMEELIVSIESSMPIAEEFRSLGRIVFH